MKKTYTEPQCHTIHIAINGMLASSDDFKVKTDDGDELISGGSGDPADALGKEADWWDD